MPGGACNFQINEDDVCRVLSHPVCMVGSYGLPDALHPHPRLLGTFPRILGHYVQERKLLYLEQIIYKMTNLSARQYSLQNRGIIKQGVFADLVIFVANKIIE